MSEQSSASTLYEPPIITGGIIKTSHPETRTRIRVNHSRTIKEGWIYETTVEIEFGGDGESDDVAALARLDALIHMARNVGEDECRARNAREGRMVVPA